MNEIESKIFDDLHDRARQLYDAVVGLDRDAGALEILRVLLDLRYSAKAETIDQIEAIVQKAIGDNRAIQIGRLTIVPKPEIH